MANVTLGNGTAVTVNGVQVQTGTENAVRGPVGKVDIIPAPAWDIGTAQEQSSGSIGKVVTILCGGSADTDLETWWTVPLDFFSLISMSVVWMEDNIVASANVVWRLALKKVVDLGTAVHASADTDTVVTAVGTGDVSHVTPLTLPNIALSPGDVVPIRIERNASSDANDTWTGGAGFEALIIRYKDKP